MLTGNYAIVAKHNKLQNVKGCEMESERSQKVRSWKDYGQWKITEMLYETQVITLWQLELKMM